MSGDHQSQYDLSSGHHECLYKMLCQVGICYRKSEKSDLLMTLAERDQQSHKNTKHLLDPAS